MAVVWCQWPVYVCVEKARVPSPPPLKKAKRNDVAKRTSRIDVGTLTKEAGEKIADVAALL
jgi:hypothetical protein